MAASPTRDIEGTPGIGTSTSRTQPRFALSFVVVRRLKAPETIWMTPAPDALRWSLPVIIQLSAPPVARVALIVSMPVVHGKPKLVAALVKPVLPLGVKAKSEMVPNGPAG